MTLAELEALCREPVELKIKASGKPVVIPLRRLTPAESRLLHEIESGLVPPKAKNEAGEDVLDFADPGYLKRVAEARIVVRALAVYLGCPMFQIDGLDPMAAESRPKIVEHVEGRLTDSLLNQIRDAVFGSDGTLERSLDFFSRRGSPAS